MAVVVYARAIVVHLRGCRSVRPVRRPEAGCCWWRQWFSSPGRVRVRVPLPTRLPGAGAALLSCAALCRADQGPRSPVAAAPVRVPLRVPVHSLVFLLRLGLRALALLLRFGPLLLLAPLALLSPRLLAPRWLDRLLRATEASGPAFVKLGQWAGTRRDLFSQDFCGRFSRLQSQARPHPWAHTERCLRRCFGAAWRRLLVLRSREPVGSGCVAQVYRGWARVEDQEVEKDQVFRRLAREEEDVLRLEEMEEEEEEAWGMPSLWGSKEVEVEEEGMQGPPAGGGRLIPVAIKVLHPGVRRQVEIDLLLMRAGSWLLHYLPGLKWLSLPEIVEEFEKLMTKQIDLRFEATNIEKFRENFQDVDFVKFPTPLRRFVTRSVLVETFEESEPIANYLRPEVPAEVKQRIARMGIETMLKMVFVDNFVHGDLHPGNILVQRPPVEAEPRGRATLTDLWDAVVVSVRPQPPPYQLVLLDAGIVAQLSPGDLANFRAVFTAVVLRQGERVAELILNHARANECRDVPRFKREMALLVDGALSTNTLSLGKIQVAELLSRVFGLLITHKVKLESNFASIVIAIMVLEGLGRSLDPNVDILELAKPMLLKNCASML